MASQDSAGGSLPVVFAGHNAYLMSVARLCREQEQFTDVVFQCSDGQLAAHRLVVSAASESLRQVLLDHVSEDEQPTTVILPEVSKSSLRILLDFIYTGKILLTIQGAHELHPLVELLGIDPGSVRLDDVATPVTLTTVIDVAPVTPVKAPEHPVLQPIVNDAVKPPAEKKAKLKSLTKSVSNKLLADKSSVKPVQINIQKSKPEKKRRNSTDCPKPAKKSRLSLPAKMDPTSSSSPTNPSDDPRKKNKVARKKADSESVPSGFHDLSKKETWVCAICECFDPPVDSVDPNQDLTDWIGCDCNRWYHKHCTKLRTFDDSFACKTVKLKCLPAE